MMDDLSHLLAVARGETLADLLLSGGNVVNVFTGEIEQADIAISQGRIAGIGPGYNAAKVVNLTGTYVSPGLIDAHVHIESSLCSPAQFARMVVPRGITTVVADPHEIANVAGADAVRWMARAAAGLALDVRLMAPSCVPATPMAAGGATLGSEEIAALRQENHVHGLAEMMNFPGVIAGSPETLAKIAAMRGRPVDGHCPGVRAQALNAYVAAGIGSDHESVSPDEAREKLARGLYLLIREATNARNLDALLPVITPGNCRRICFCSDDRTPGDLLRFGSIDDMVRRAIAFGIPPIDAIRMATLNTAEWFGLHDIGAIAPGRVANLWLFDDLQKPQTRMVFSRGIQVTDALLAAPAAPAPSAPPASSPSAGIRAPQAASLGTCAVDWNNVSLKIPAKGTKIRVIGSRPDQLVTDSLLMAARITDGHAEADVERDILKMAVIERHGGSGKTGLGFIKRFGLSRGAIAGTIAHDHHNLLLIGADDASMRTAGQAVTEMGGGLAVAQGARVLARLKLDIAGLMSSAPAESIAADYDALISAARSLGATLTDPFMAMSFMALEVIPSLKLTEQGLVDVEKFGFVDLFA